MENNPLKILVIDDNEDNLTSVKALIRDSFPQAIILTATEAGKGIKLAQAENPDVILLDVVMPGMDGFEACQQLKADPLTRYIPVMFLTANRGDKEARIRALDVGAEAFLSKPIDEIELTAQIRAMQKIKGAGERERAEKGNLADLVMARTRELDLAHKASLNLLEDLRKENTVRREIALRLQESVHAANVGLWAWDLATNCVEYSPEWKRQIGYDDAEIGDSFEEWESRVHPEDLAPTLEKIREAITGDSRRYQAEFRFRHKDGSYRWIVAQCSVLRAENGKGVRVVGSHIDLTEFKSVEESLRASQQLTESIIESIPGAFYMLDEAGKYVRWNAYQRDEIVGKPEDQIAGFPAIDTIHPDDRALLQARIANVLQTGVVETVEGRVLLRGGPKFRWLLMTGRQLVVAGHTYLLGIGIDITVRKQAEEVQARQLEELQRWQTVTLGREGRIGELKREVNMLAARLGMPPPYGTPESVEWKEKL